MNITKKSNNGFTVVNLEGRIDTTNFSVFENELNVILQSGEKDICVNCKDLTYISSSGLRVFLIILKKVTAMKGKFVLCEMQPSILEIFNISGFSTIFKIFESEEAATAS